MWIITVVVARAELPSVNVLVPLGEMDTGFCLLDGNVA